MAVCIYIFDDQMLFNNNTTPATFRHIAHKSQQQRQINVIYVCTYTHAEEWHGYRDGWENGMLGVGGEGTVPVCVVRCGALLCRCIQQKGIKNAILAIPQDLQWVCPKKKKC